MLIRTAAALTREGFERVARDFADPAEAGATPELRGRIRATQVAAIARLTPAIMPANALNALAVLIVFALEGEPLGPVALWAGAAIAAAGWFLWSWRRKSRKPFPETLPPATARRAVRNAALLAALWAVPSVVFMPTASETTQAFLLLIAGGMVSGGVTCFYPIPKAAAAYSGVLILGAIVGAAQASAAGLVGGLIVVLSYYLVVRRVIARHSEIFVSEIVARVALEEKTRRVEALMAETRRESERKLRETARRSEQAQKMEAVGQLTGGMAHDFNNILSVIRGNAELQREAAVKDEGLIAEVIAATERGADVIHKLLAFSRRQALHPEPIDAGATAEEAAAVLHRILDERIAVTVAAAPDAPPALADPTQLQSALINLALNARDAMPEGGTLEIESAVRAVGAEEARGLEDRLGHEVAPGRYLAIRVRDHGSGMTPEVAAHAVEPFFSTKPVGRGSGLGLSMVLGFTRQSGGFLTLDTAPGDGTAATIHLPVCEAASRRAGRAENGPVPTGAGERVLLVEDREDVRETLARMLRELGYEVCAAAEAAEAMARLEEGPAPDLVLSDVVLPGGATGYDLADRLAAERPGLPVILISGFPDATAALGAGRAARAALRKPFSREDLARAIRHALSETDDPPGDGAAG